MKKSLIALAALATTGAFAQSSVTLSGILDGGIVYSSNAAAGVSKFSLGQANNNRLIFSGVEDLGGGLAGTFAAQIRFDPFSGTNERGNAGFITPSIPNDANGTPVGTVAGVNYGRPLFQGETRVGLRGAFGAIRIGRGLTALQAPNGGVIDPWGVSTVAGSIYAPGYATDYVQGGEGRTDGIFYDTPNFSGLSGSLTYSPRKGKPGGKDFYSIAVNYANGPIVALVGYERNRFGDTLTNIGGNYNFGPAKLFLGYGRTKGGSFADRSGVAFLATAGNAPGLSYVAAGGKQDAMSIGATVPMGAAKFLAGYSSFKADGGKRENKLGLGVDYALSKRTSAYSNIGSTTRSTANTSRVNQFDLGVTHRF